MSLRRCCPFFMRDTMHKIFKRMAFTIGKALLPLVRIATLCRLATIWPEIWYCERWAPNRHLLALFRRKRRRWMDGSLQKCWYLLRSCLASLANSGRTQIWGLGTYEELSATGIRNSGVTVSRFFPKLTGGGGRTRMERPWLVCQRLRIAGVNISKGTGLHPVRGAAWLAG